jgi:vacuolar-type H+-ATPase subunit E/Vma4
MKAEILEEARKKAEHILGEADEESARELESGRALAAKTSEEMARDAADRIERRRSEAEARLPIDRMRERTDFVDRALRRATSDFVAALPEAEVARLAAAIVAALAPGLAGKRTRVSRRGISAASAAAAAAALGPGAVVEAAEDPALGASGLVAAAEDGSARLTATMDLVEERLVDSRRRELALALCARAMALDARNLGPAGGKELGS